MPVGNLLFAAFEKHQAIHDACVQTRDKPGATAAVVVAEHTLTSSQRPQIDIDVAGKDFEVLELVLTVTLRIQMLGRNETAAVRLVQSKIDQLVAVNFTSATVPVGGSLTSDVTNYNDTPVAGYTRRWQIAAIAGETRVRTLTVTVIPTVTDRRTNSQVQLTTIIRDP